MFRLLFRRISFFISSSFLFLENNILSISTCVLSGLQHNVETLGEEQGFSPFGYAIFGMQAFQILSFPQLQSHVRGAMTQKQSVLRALRFLSLQREEIFSSACAIKRRRLFQSETSLIFLLKCWWPCSLQSVVSVITSQKSAHFGQLLFTKFKQLKTTSWKDPAQILNIQECQESDVKLNGFISVLCSLCRAEFNRNSIP